MMETLSDVYEELNYLHLKYQYLREVCRILLKKWPSHAPAGKPFKEKKADNCSVDKKDVQCHSIQSSESLECNIRGFPTTCTSTDEVPGNLDKLTQVDDILERAQKIRLSKDITSGKRASKSTRLSGKSSELASKVYGAETTKTPKAVVSQSMKRTKSLSSSKDVSSSSTKTDRQLTRAPKFSLSNTTKLNSTSKSRHVLGREDKLALEDKSHRLKTKSSVQPSQNDLGNKDRTTKVVSLAVNDDRRSGEAVHSRVLQQREAVEEPGDSCSFHLHLHGTRLAMPSKYYHLHRTLTKLNNEMKQESTLSSGHGHQHLAPGDHFTKRLNRKSKESLEAVQLHLTRSEYEDIKEMILSMTPQEWTVSERSTWQEILVVKLKLDAILECVQMLKKPEVPVSTPTIKQRKEVLSTCEAPLSRLSHEVPFCYASLEEWQSVAACGHHQHWLTSKKHILKFLMEELIPQISLMKEETSDSIESVRTLTGTLRAVYELAGIEPKPIYIMTDC